MTDDRPVVIRRRWTLRRWQQGVLLWLVAFVPGALTATQRFSQADERLWMRRSEHYARAYLSLDLPNATSSVSGRPTMPGITTSVIGGVARVIWGGLRDLGVASFPGEGFRKSLSALMVSQLLMAAATASLIVLLWWVLSKWATHVVATTAALILATEPFLVAEGTKLKTDSLLMLFGAVGAFGLAAALGVPAARRVDPRQRRWLAIAAGIGVGGALASKLTALTFGPFLLGLVLYAALRARRSRAGVRDVLVVTALTSIVAVGLLVVLWPAVWADPGGQLEVLRGTTRLPGGGHIQFFLGDVTRDPGPLFYFVTVPFRMTPWLFLLAVPGVIVSLRSKALRGFALVALAYAAVPLIVITFADKKFVRYSLPLWPVLAVLVGLLVQHLATWCRAQGPSRQRAFEVCAAGAIAGIVVYTMLVVPYGTAYANPALGAGPVAQQVMLIGGDTAAEAGAIIRDREGDRCAQRRILANPRPKLWFPCGDGRGNVEALRRGDYIVLFDNILKRGGYGQADGLRALGRRVAMIRNRGVDVAEIIQVTDPAR